MERRQRLRLTFDQTSHLVHHLSRVSDLQADLVHLCRPADGDDGFGEACATQHQERPCINRRD